MSVIILLCVNVFCVFAQESVSDYYNSDEEFNFLASDILNSSTALTLRDRASGVTVTFKDKTKLPENLSVSSYRIISGDIYDKIKIRFWKIILYICLKSVIKHNILLYLVN